MTAWTHPTISEQPQLFRPTQDEAMQLLMPGMWLLPEGRSVGMWMPCPVVGAVVPGIVLPPQQQRSEEYQQVHTPTGSESWNDTGDSFTRTSTDDKDLAFAQAVAQALASVRSEEKPGPCKEKTDPCKERVKLRKESPTVGAATKAPPPFVAGKNDFKGNGSTCFGRKPIYGKNFCPSCGNPRNIEHNFCPLCAFQF